VFFHTGFYVFVCRRILEIESDKLTKLSLFWLAKIGENNQTTKILLRVKMLQSFEDKTDAFPVSIA